MVEQKDTKQAARRTIYVIVGAISTFGGGAVTAVVGAVAAVALVFILLLGMLSFGSSTVVAQAAKCTVTSPVAVIPGAPATGTGTADTRLIGSNHQEQALNFFVNNGFTKGQAAGIVGNLMVESGPGLDPTITNSIGAHGIAQWLYGRLSQLNSFAAHQKNPRLRNPDLFLTQLLFVLHELNGGFSNVRHEMNTQVADRNRPTTQADIYTAAGIWNRGYEVSGSSSQPRAERGWQVYLKYGAKAGTGTTTDPAPPEVPTGSIGDCPADPGGTDGTGLPNAKLEAFVQAALTQVGKPYIFGAESPTVGFDCSGLTQWATARVGYKLPRLAHVQYRYGTAVDRAHLQRGDLVFWAKDTSNPNTIYHVGTYLGGGKLLSAPHPGADVRVSTMYYSRGFIGGRRLFQSSAPLPTTSQGWQIPLPAGSYTLTSPFGLRYHPVKHHWSLHDGQDLGAALGTPIRAASNGVVNKVLTQKQNPHDYGNYVVIQHLNGVQTGYAHMIRFAPGIHPGVAVERGQIIGYVGKTGSATGYHLHYNVKVNGNWIDPLIFMTQQGISF